MEYIRVYGSICEVNTDMKGFQVALLVIVFSILTFGQVTKSESLLTGTVYDINKAVVGGAKIKIVDSQGKSFATTTNDKGEYYILLEPGKYTAEFTSNGFKVLRVVDLKIDLADKRKLDVTFEVGRCEDCNGAIYGERWDDIAYVSGVVLDANGAAVGNTKVTFRESENTVRTTQTSNDGKYVMKLPIGSVQSIEFEAVGFKIFKVEKYKIGPAQKGSLNLDVSLDVRSCDDPSVRCLTVTGTLKKNNL